MSNSQEEQEEDSTQLLYQKFKDAIFFVAENQSRFTQQKLTKLENLKESIFRELKQRKKEKESFNPTESFVKAKLVYQRSPDDSLGYMSNTTFLSSFSSGSLAKPRFSNFSNFSRLSSQLFSGGTKGKSFLEKLKKYIDLVIQSFPETSRLLSYKYEKSNFNIALTKTFFEEIETENLLKKADIMTFERSFYRDKDKKQLEFGIGEIVKFGVNFGEEELDKKLKEKYDLSLTEFEKDKIAMRKLERKQLRDAKKRQKRLIRKEKDKNKKRWRQRLYRYFSLVDDSMLLEDFSSFIHYAEKKGRSDLNQKLALKYGVDLDSIKTIPEEEKIQMKKKFSSEAFDEAAEENLHFIKLFYAKYQPGRVLDGSFIKVYEWSKRNGLDSLEEELQKRFKTSFYEFCEIVKSLKEELINFYTKIDKKVLNQDRFEKVLVWALGNDRSGLNVQLFNKYQKNLNTI
eukprot:snap_masked-scaffold_59-processed-gene-0.32-mRNA-1 protein AED:1.00 eAED:1.00 QI:0/0/0/0/1/1/2/0/456